LLPEDGVIDLAHGVLLRNAADRPSGDVDVAGNLNLRVAGAEQNLLPSALFNGSSSRLLDGHLST
jgi:hypothetical protein